MNPIIPGFISQMNAQLFEGANTQGQQRVQGIKFTLRMIVSFSF